MMETVAQVKMVGKIQVRTAEPNKADEPKRVCPRCGGYPLVLEGVAGQVERTFCDFCPYEKWSNK